MPIIVLAGFPQDQIEAHKKAGVDEFIHIRADARRSACQNSRPTGN